MDRIFKQTFFNEEKQMATKHTERCSISLANKEMQIKTKRKYHHIGIRMAKIKRTVSNVGECMEELVLSTGTMYNW